MLKRGTVGLRSTALASASPLGQVAAGKFQDPNLTASGEPRAVVPFARLETLWVNTGTMCNITCRNCYIESSPQNDRLVYISASECAAFFDEIVTLGLGTPEIGFTGGEPFLNPDMLAMTGDALGRGHTVLILTNGMQPLQRPDKNKAYSLCWPSMAAICACGSASTITASCCMRPSRGRRTWDKALAGIDWLSSNGFRIAIAGRTCWGESDESERAGYAALIRSRGWQIDPDDPKQLMLLPEMDGLDDVPEITAACWDILGKSPAQIMCATSRMIVKRKGAATPVVVPGTLLPTSRNSKWRRHSQVAERRWRHVRPRRGQTLPLQLRQILRTRRWWLFLSAINVKGRSSRGGHRAVATAPACRAPNRRACISPLDERVADLLEVDLGCGGGGGALRLLGPAYSSCSWP